MGFLSPLWLWALAAIALPVALHLLSRGRGRRVQLASTRLLPSALSLRGRRLSPSDMPLLFLRTLLLAAVGLALAGAWWQHAATSTAGSWLLLEPGVRTAATGQAAERLGRWRSEAREVRYLAPGLPGSEPATDRLSPDAWSLLLEADRAAPPGVELRVATRGRLGELQGERPALTHAVSWLAVPATGAERALIAAGPWTGSSVRGIVETTVAAGSRVTTVDLPPGTTRAGLVAVQTGNHVSLALDGAPALAVGASTLLTLALHADAAHAASAAVWLAACEVAGRALGASATRVEQPAGAAVRLWLDDRAPPAEWASGNGVLVTEAPSPGVPCFGSAVAEGEPIVVQRCEEGAAGTAGAAEWRTAGGSALIQESVAGSLRTWHLRTRAAGEWSNLALGDTLPRRCAAWLAAELARRGELVAMSRFDRRSVADEQRVPRRSTNAAGASARREDLSSWLWLVAAALAFAERSRARRIG
ncbi:MAG: BatA domain-containing protein [Acidobacteriota bacterium]